MLLYFSTTFIPYRGNKVKYNIKKVKLEDFRVLKLLPDTKITFIKDDSNFMEIPVPENSNIPSMYKLKGDTLEIQPYQTQMEFENIKIHGRNVISLVSNKAYCYLRMKTDSLNLTGDKESSFFFEEGSEVQNLNGKLSGKSIFRAENLQVKSIILNLTGNSDFSARTRIIKALVTLKENSTFRVGKIDSLVLYQEGRNQVYFEGY